MTDNNPALMSTNLAYSRSIGASSALLTAYDSAQPADPQPVLVRLQKGRGAFLNSYLDDKGEIAKDFDDSNPNLVGGDISYLPPNCDTLLMKFSLNFTAESRKPYSCELPELDELLQKITDAYREAGGYRYLAERYLWRLLNGSVLSRNYTVSAEKTITVTLTDDGQHTVWEGKCRNLPKNKFPGSDVLRQSVANVDALVDLVAGALGNPDKGPLILSVSASGIVGYGAEVFPSQVFDENAKEKVLASYDLGNGKGRQSLINATKITNAIRHIDEWHGHPEHDAISVEAYGFVQRSLEALRPGNKRDNNFYNVLWQQSESFPDLIANSVSVDKIPDNVHYFIAMLIRGGVFTAPASKESKEAKADRAARRKEAKAAKKNGGM